MNPPAKSNKALRIVAGVSWSSSFVLGGIHFHTWAYYAGTAHPHAKLLSAFCVLLFIVSFIAIFVTSRKPRKFHIAVALSLVFVPVFIFGTAFGSIAFKVGAVGRGHQKCSIANMVFVANKLEAYRSSQGRYPRISGASELQSIIEFDSLVLDGWGYPLVVESSENQWSIRSTGKYGKLDDDSLPNSGATWDLSADIVLLSTGWQKYPEGCELPNP